MHPYTRELINLVHVMSCSTKGVSSKRATQCAIFSSRSFLYGYGLTLLSVEHPYKLSAMRCAGSSGILTSSSAGQASRLMRLTFGQRILTCFKLRQKAILSLSSVLFSMSSLFAGPTILPDMSISLRCVKGTKSRAPAWSTVGPMSATSMRSRSGHARPSALKWSKRMSVFESVRLVRDFPLKTRRSSTNQQPDTLIFARLGQPSKMALTPLSVRLSLVEMSADTSFAWLASARAPSSVTLPLQCTIFEY